jgi:aryl-alcohol dehydrogenase-like predicted oxidoreductase
VKIADINVSPLCLGGNVFGWTADEQESFAVLDAYVAAGGNFIDTADVYSAWAPGHEGGESETIIGRWLASRGNRDQVVIATKVGMLSGHQDLTVQGIRAAAENSLQRLGTDYIDLYYAHVDDQSTPLAETLAGFDALVREGKVRQLGASNHTAERLTEALETAEREGLTKYVALQPPYNLVDRAKYEGELAAVVAANDLACVPYFGLARGFLTGKYRPGQTDTGSPRAGAASRLLDNPNAMALLAVLDEISAERQVPMAAVALAWVAAQPTITAPISSARNPQQLAEMLRMNEVELTPEELARLSG